VPASFIIVFLILPDFQNPKRTGIRYIVVVTSDCLALVGALSGTHLMYTLRGGIEAAYSRSDLNRIFFSVPRHALKQNRETHDLPKLSSSHA
jgi:hypothetical protein